MSYALLTLQINIDKYAKYTVNTSSFYHFCEGLKKLVKGLRKLARSMVFLTPFMRRWVECMARLDSVLSPWRTGQFGATKVTIKDYSIFKGQITKDQEKITDNR